MTPEETADQRSQWQERTVRSALALLAQLEDMRRVWHEEAPPLSPAAQAHLGLIKEWAQRLEVANAAQ